MERYWVPLLLTNDEPEFVDMRQGTALGGIGLTLLNNAEPIKLTAYTVPIVLLTIYIYGLYSQAREGLMTEFRFLANLANQATGSGDAGTGMLLALSALPDARAEVSRPYVPEAEEALTTAIGNPHEVVILSGHHGSVAKAAFSPDGRRVSHGIR